MAVYLFSFSASILLIAIAQKKRLPVFLVLSTIALLIPCLVAGLREQTIGTDVMVYVKPLTSAAIQADNFSEFMDTYWFDQWRNLYVQDYELGFSLLVYVVARLTQSLGAVLFVIQAFMIVPVYIALARNRKDLPIWLGMLVYYFLFYNTTLNMMRQWIAMAFLLLAFQLLRERKPLLALILSVAAVFFHTTAMVALPIFLLLGFLWVIRRSRFVHNNLRLQGASVVTVILFAVALLAILNLPIILKVLALVGFGEYSNYLQGDSIQLMLGQLIWRLPLLVLILLCWKDMCRKDNTTPFYLATVLLDMVLSQLVSINDNALRIGAYLSVYTILWIPSTYRCCQSSFKRNIITVLVICYAVFYWYYTYVYAMRHMTYPYQFAPI